MGRRSGLPWQHKDASELSSDLIAMFSKWPWSQYDGVPDPNPDQVTILDAVLSVVLESNFIYGTGRNEWETLRPVIDTCNAFLSEFGQEVQLWEDTEQTSASVERLTEIIMALSACRSWRASKLTKVLHRKRPSLIPILDSVMLRAFGQARNDKDEDVLSNSGVALVMFRGALIEGLPRIGEAVQTLHEQAPGLCPTITPVRAAEALIYWNGRSKSGIRGGWDGTDWQ